MMLAMPGGRVLAGAKPDISFCMIVRNAGATLSRCLNSVAGLVDEMLVVDTGSTDDSMDVARSHGARVIRTPWRDDFAAARNVYIESARCSWILSLDADEALAQTDAGSLRNMLSLHSRSVYVFTIRNYFALEDWSGPMAPSAFGGEVEPGVGWTPTRTVRLFPRVRGLAYRYPVHESLIPAARAQGLSVRSCGTTIHHTGMLQPIEDRRRKNATYRELGLKKLAEYPRYFLAYFELGKVYFAEGDISNADRMFTLCLRLNPFFSRAYYYLIMASLRAGHPVQAKQRAQRALLLFPRNTDLRYAQGLAELERGDVPTALALIAPALHRMPPPAGMLRDFRAAQVGG